MDKVIIEELRTLAHVGVPLAERRRRQRVVIDCQLRLNLKPAGQQDRVEDTVDYAAVVTEIQRLVKRHSFRLVEAMAESVASVILSRFPVDNVRVRVRKFSVPGTKSVGVEITRADRSRRRSGSPRGEPR